MNAIEFVKKFGLNMAKFHLSMSGTGAKFMQFDIPEHGLKNVVLNCYDIKRLVKAHELVEKAGGFDESKDILGNVKPWSAGYNILSNTYFSGDIFSIDQEFYISDLFEAIKLVEQCQ